MPILIIALLLIGGGGTSFVAESTAPGDFLYPIKVKINEKIADAVLISDESQVRWETRKAERRVEETVKLMEEGDISDEAVAQLEEEFNRHVQKIDELVAKFESDKEFAKALEASSFFEISLRKQEGILEQFKENKTGDLNIEMLKHLRERKEEAAEKRENQEEKLIELGENSFENSAENRRESVVKQINETANYLTKMGETFGKDFVAEAEKVLDEARLTLTEGEQKLLDGEYKEAFYKFAEARKKAYESKDHIVREEYDSMENNLQDRNDEEGRNNKEDKYETEQDNNNKDDSEIENEKDDEYDSDIIEDEDKKDKEDKESNRDENEV